MMAITGKTSILLMLADPVGHVRGSAVINQSFEDMGLDAVIAPLHVRPADLDFILKAARRMQNVSGLSVTIPHKIAALHLVDQATDAARRIGAVNFIRRNADGSLLGHNIDGQSFVTSLEGNGIAVAGMRALIVGSGGVGRAIAFALADAGVGWLGIANRSDDKAAALARDVAAAVPGCTASVVALTDRQALVDIDLLVNATALGLRADDPLPIALEGLSARTTVADVIVHPPMTPLLLAAKERGCQVIAGEQMLKLQPALVAEFMDLARKTDPLP